jgi:hypothetical protein
VDWIVADEDGVVYVPVNMVYKVVEVDARCMADIGAGKGVHWQASTEASGNVTSLALKGEVIFQQLRYRELKGTNGKIAY